MILKKGGFRVGSQTFTEGDTGKTALCLFFSRTLLRFRNQTLQGRIPPAMALRTLSRNDRAIINVPMAEARDFHCHSHVTDNLGEPSIPSDHVAVRVVIRKPFDFCGIIKHFPNWTSKTSRLLLHFEADQ